MKELHLITSVSIPPGKAAVLRRFSSGNGGGKSSVWSLADGHPEIRSANTNPKRADEEYDRTSHRAVVFLPAYSS